MGAHARFSPSSGKRYLSCTPSLRLEEQFEDEQSPYAAEGSAGHAMAEYLINKHLKKRTRRPTSDYYTEELLEAVEEYATYCIGQIEQARAVCGSPFISVEQKVSLEEHIEGCFGTADMVIATDGKLQIIDLKLGKGVVVDAEENIQLMIYGQGMLDMVSALYDISTVELTIVQPRLEHFSTWEISAADLRKWTAEVLEPGARMALAGEGEYKAGDHCRFCRARFKCRARADEYLKLAQNEAVINHKEWPGFKLVLGRSNRKYTDEADAAEAAKQAGYTDIYKQSLIGITEMEKLMGKKKFNEILGNYVYKPDGKVTLVPDSDKREAVKTATAEADFKEE